VPWLALKAPQHGHGGKPMRVYTGEVAPYHQLDKTVRVVIHDGDHVKAYVAGEFERVRTGA
jgi:hypothetical protein